MAARLLCCPPGGSAGSKHASWWGKADGPAINLAVGQALGHAVSYTEALDLVAAGERAALGG